MLASFLLFLVGGNLESLSDCVLRTDNEPYTGTVSVTNNGIPCQAWASSFPHRHTMYHDKYFPVDGSAQAAKNYCRNYGDYRSPFCYTTNPDILWGKCTLRICNGEDANQDPVVQSIVSLTISLRHKFVKQISAKVTNTLLFFVEKM